MAVNYEYRNWGFKGHMTRCHNGVRKKIGLSKHTLEVVSYIDTMVNGGKKWEVSHIKL